MMNVLNLKSNMSGNVSNIFNVKLGGVMIFVNIK